MSCAGADLTAPGQHAEPVAESMRAWNLRGLGVELGDVLLAAAALPAGGPRIDPNDPAFLPPGDMPQRIVAAAGLSDPGPEVVVVGGDAGAVAGRGVRGHRVARQAAGCAPVGQRGPHVGL